MELKDSINTFVDGLDKDYSEDAYHNLLEAKENIDSILINNYHQKNDVNIKTQLIEIIWKRNQYPEISNFLSEALADPKPEIWKNALDGLVSIGGTKALDVLKQVKFEDNTKTEWVNEAIIQIEKA